MACDARTNDSPEKLLNKIAKFKWRGRCAGQAFYADLLRDLGVSLVVGLGGDDYDRGPLEAAGLDVCGIEDLGGDPAAERPSLQVRASSWS